MARFLLHPRIYGAEFGRTGQRPNVKRDGTLEVHNDDLISDIRRSSARAEGLVLELNTLGSSTRNMPTRYCPQCHLSIWPWDTSCGRCGAETPKEGDDS